MARLRLESEPSIIPVPSNADVASPPQDRAPQSGQAPKSNLTFTGIIGTICWFPLKAIIAVCVALRIHPNVLTLVGVIVNIAAAWALGKRRFVLAGVVMIIIGSQLQVRLIEEPYLTATHGQAYRDYRARGHHRIYRRRPGVYEFQLAHQLLAADALEQITRRSYSQRLVEVLLVVVHRQHHHFAVRVAVPKFTAQVQAAGALHPDVAQHDVGLQLVDDGRGAFGTDNWYLGFNLARKFY